MRATLCFFSAYDIQAIRIVGIGQALVIFESGSNGEFEVEKGKQGQRPSGERHTAGKMISRVYSIHRDNHENYEEEERRIDNVKI